MRRRLLWLLAGLALGGAAGACGKAALRHGALETLPGPSTSPPQGAIALVTKNTTRLGAADAAADAAAVALAVERLVGVAQGQPHQVIVLSEDAAPALQMPAAGLAAESGAPILFVSDAALPAATAAALASLHRPDIYLLGAPGVSASTL